MKPMVVGLQRALPDSASAGATAALWHWQVTAQGEQVATLGVVVPGALGLRLGVWVQALPAGAWLCSYGPGAWWVRSVRRNLQAQAERNRQVVPRARGRNNTGTPTAVVNKSRWS